MRFPFQPFLQRAKAIKKLPYILAVFLIVCQFGFQLHLAARDAQTSDEAVHLSAGLTYWQQHDYRFNPEHPPLVKLMAALPLTVLQFNQPESFDYLWNRADDFFYDSWRENRWYGEDLLFKSNNNADQLLFWGRVGPAALTLALAVTIFVMAATFFGPWGGLFSLLLYVLDPTITAHGHLVTTDIGATLGTLLTAWALFLFLKHKTWKQALILGLCLGLALITKFTTIILVPLLLVFVLVDWFKNRKDRDTFRILLSKIVTIGAVAWLVILLAYAPQWHRPPAAESVTTRISQTKENASPINATTDRVYSVARTILIPADYFKGLSLVLSHTQGGHTSFLFGEHSRTGWWYYFPAVILMKTPIATLAVFLALIWVITRRQENHGTIRFLGSFALLLLLFSMTSKANLGVRHILPVYGLLFVAAGSLVACSKLKQKWILGVVILCLMFGFIRMFPYYLAYFNPLFGGSYNGSQFVSDSNVDWGQDLKEIKTYISTNEVGSPYIIYDWSGDLALKHYAIPHRSIANFAEDPTGYVVISSSAIHDERYAWLQTAMLVDRITPSVLVYKLP